MQMIQNSAVPHHPSSASVSAQTQARVGLFSRLLAALHQSRHLQTAQIIHRYQHLVTEDTGYIVMLGRSEAPAATRPEADDRRDAGRSDHSHLSLRRLAARLLIFLVIIGFGALHVVGGTLLDHSNAPPRNQSPAPASPAQGD